MSKVAIPVFETTVQKTHLWLKDIAELMKWEDQHLAYLSLRAVLHALRDRLPIEVTAKLGAQFPMLIRGIYYEGWIPVHTPLKIHHSEDFLDLIESYLGHDSLSPYTDSIARAVFKVMKMHLSEGEINHLKSVLLPPIASFFS